MSDETCAFCLGGKTEIPPFGSLKDAEDFLCPCGTCSLVTHRKCLVDWFNSIPSAQIARNYASEPTQSADSRDQSPDLDHDMAQSLERSLRDTDSVPEATENEANTDQNVFDISLRSRWLTVVGQYNASQANSADSAQSTESAQNEAFHRNDDRVLLSTACPQCKSRITFQIKKLPLLTLNGLIRNTISDTVQYSGILVGLTGAATGIVTMGYVGLARCGVSIIDALVPVSLISQLFGRPTPKSGLASQHSLSASISPLSGTASSSPLTSQLKFQHIPLLPVMLYRMRYSSLIDCLLRRKPGASVTEWVSELLLCNYVSSLGNHVLFKQLYKNFKAFVARSVTDKRSLLQLGLLFKGIDWWDPAVMVASTIPARWVYDVAYRFTVNKLHFDLNAHVRPREIANSLSPEHLDKLERLESQITGLRYCISQRVKHARGSKNSYAYYYGSIREIVRLFRDQTAFKLVQLKFLHWYYKSKACMQHDYSSTLLHRSVLVTGVSTILWPFISADLGKVIHSVLISKMSSLAEIEKDKLVFLSNLLAMALVAVLKDLGNLFLCLQKSRQLSELTVVTQKSREPASRAATYRSPFPGAFDQ